MPTLGTPQAIPTIGGEAEMMRRIMIDAAERAANPPIVMCDKAYLDFINYGIGATRINTMTGEVQHFPLNAIWSLYEP